MKNKSGIYKIVAICASAIVAVTMTLPTITSAVGLVGNARSASAVSGAAAPKGATRSAGAGSDSSTSSDDNIDLSGATWIENTKRNLEWTLVGKDKTTLVLRQKDENSTVDASELIDPDSNTNGNGIFDKTGSFNIVHASSIKKIVIDGELKVHNAEHMFRCFDYVDQIQGLKNIKFVKKDGKPVKVDGMFTGMGNYPEVLSHRNSFKKLDGIENWDMENVEDAHDMFERCGKLKSLDLSGWQHVNFTDIQGMFQYCNSLETVKLFSAQNGTLQTINNLFQDTPNLKAVNGFENWNTSNVTDMRWMFANTETPNTHLKNLNGFENWDTSKVTDMNAMFYNLTALESIKSIEKWNTSNVTNMSSMFSKTSSLSSIGSLANWSIGYVKDMYGMFYGSGVESLDLRNWIFPQGKVQYGNSSHYATAGMFQDSGLRDITLFMTRINKINGSHPIFPDGIWRESKGESAIKPGENIDFVTNNGHPDFFYIRWVRDYIDVTFENKTDNKTIKCVADVLQGNGKTYNLSNANFVSCKYESKNPKDPNAFKNKPIKFETIKNAMGIVDGDTVKWQGDYKPVFKRVSWKQIDIGNNKKITTFIMNNGVQYNDNELFEPSMKGNPVKYDKVENAKIYSVFDVTFTANVTHKQKPKPPVPTPPEPEPTPTPTPEHGPDDSDILPDITTKPDLNINSNHDFVYPFIKQPQKSPQPTQGADVENNVLQRAEAENNSNFGIKKQFNSNSGTCKCVCPTLPRVTKSHKSNKSARKSSNKAVPCKSGNNYSWLGIGGLIISWLIMLLIGFILGYKMRKKRDDEQSDENQSAIKD